MGGKQKEGKEGEQEEEKREKKKMDEEAETVFSQAQLKLFYK